jgi:hypothetical protein
MCRTHSHDEMNAVALDRRGTVPALLSSGEGLHHLVQGRQGRPLDVWSV